MSKPFVAILPSTDPMTPEWRLRVERESIDSGIIYICEERVHPEQVSNPDANFVAESDQIGLTWDEFVWVRAQLETIAKLDTISHLRILLTRAQIMLSNEPDASDLLNDINEVLDIQTDEARAIAKQNFADLMGVDL